MDDIAIRVENLSKRYRIGEKVPYKALRDEISKFFTAPFKNVKNNTAGKRKNEYIWALKDISFEIHRGEVVGIIGKNGVGKTTLLKILSRITEPTEGYAEIHGRVGSLLEVGTGFHPELTGRENIYLNAAILSMRKEEIDRKFNDIIAFAEVEKLIDTPVKRYSSGMYVRLAFAVAAHLEPEILLVDEVLAVGDISFQKKCLGKMKDVAREGRTVLFVSHNMGSISTLCEKVMLITEGHIDFIGPTQKTISRYLASVGADANFGRKWSFEKAPGGKNVKIKSVSITDDQNNPKSHFSTTEPIFVTIEYWVLDDGIPVNIHFSLFDEQGNMICGVGNYKETRLQPIRKHGLYRSKCTIPDNLLNSGRHMITIESYTNALNYEISIPHCVVFETVDDQRIHPNYSRWAGIIKPEFEWVSKKIDGHIPDR